MKPKAKAKKAAERWAILHQTAPDEDALEYFRSKKEARESLNAACVFDGCRVVKL